MQSFTKKRGKERKNFFLSKIPAFSFDEKEEKRYYICTEEKAYGLKARKGAFFSFLCRTKGAIGATEAKKLRYVAYSGGKAVNAWRSGKKR